MARGRSFQVLFVLSLMTISAFAQHGPCVTEFGSPGDGNDANWILIFSRAQLNQPNNPKNAKYGDNWAAASAAYPWIQPLSQGIIKSFADQGLKVSTSDPNMPFTRVCVPSPLGLKNGLKPHDMVIHVNPTGPNTDATATLFYKGFIRKGKVVTSGKSAH